MCVHAAPDYVQLIPTSSLRNTDKQAVCISSVSTQDRGHWLMSAAGEASNQKKASLSFLSTRHGGG